MPRQALVSAALRHVRDAEHLLTEGPHRSVEQALHLAGFGPECVRKGCVDDAVADKALGHDLRGAGDSVVDFLLALDPGASRYDLGGRMANLPHRHKHWNVHCRYMETGAATPTEDDIIAVVREARAVVDLCVAELWCDGALRAPR